MRTIEKHPSYGYLTREEYEAAKNCGAEMTKYYKKLQEQRAKEVKKQKQKERKNA